MIQGVRHRSPRSSRRAGTLAGMTGEVMTAMPDESTVDDDRRLAAWKQRMNPVIIAAAIVPIVVSLTERGQSRHTVWIDLASWLVFAVDYVVHLRLRPGYPRSKAGIFDATIVVITAPWYLIPGFGASRFLGLARLGRLGRVFIVSTHSAKLQDLGRRLGHAAIYSAVLMACCALVVHTVEPESSGFETIGDSLWWAIVTFTTVGYGDYFPVTRAGRLAAVLLMVGGIALIGSLAGTLGTFFAAQDDEADEDAAAATSDAILAELRLLRAEVAELRDAQDPRPQT